MRFAALESAIFGHPDAATGVNPGAGGIQHLKRLMGRARALEVMLIAQDYDAESVDPGSSSKRKVVHADTGIQKFDFESSLCNAAVLANQLIHARFADQTGSVLIHVHALRTRGFFSIDEDTETHGI
jgi:1,4-dihydroxy-2-naphthoyl-CoA synthase